MSFKNFYNTEYVGCKKCESYHLIDLFKEAGKMETSKYQYFSYIHKDCGSKIELIYKKGCRDFRPSIEHLHYSGAYH